MNYARKSALIATLSAIALTGCTDTSGFDFDFRRNQYNTADAALKATEARPKPDDKGIINYPTYQVAVARRGDTLRSLANRIGMDADALAKYNGTSPNAQLHQGEVVSLPSKVASSVPAPSDVTTSTLDGGNDVNITELAQTAIGTSSASAKPSTNQPGKDPIRHRVERGETAYTIARLYRVSVRSLAEWNGLDSNLNIREGQYLTIPVASEEPAKPVAAKPKVTAPGTGTPTPTPPSAKAPLPVAPVAPATPTVSKPAPVVQKPVAAPTGGKMAYPVQGKIIREYVKGKTDGIDLSAPVGTSIVAADKGTVAAITADADQVPIVVIKHDNGLLTVYANVGDIKVAKGSAVSRGQKIGSIRDGNPAYLHFEVRRGFDSVDPMDFLK